MPGGKAFGHCPRVSATYEEGLMAAAYSEDGLVGVGGFEPPTSWSQTTRSSLAELHPAQAQRTSRGNRGSRERPLHQRQPRDRSSRPDSSPA
jgi:hypothetical protein